MGYLQKRFGKLLRTLRLTVRYGARAYYSCLRLASGYFGTALECIVVRLQRACIRIVEYGTRLTAAILVLRLYVEVRCKFNFLYFGLESVVDVASA